MEDEWTVEANEAVSVSLVRLTPRSIQTIAYFQPKFTYPIFGQDEHIFGYKNLNIALQFDARDLRPNVDVRFSKKFKKVGDIEATPVEDILKEFLPAVAFQNRNAYCDAMKNLPDTWTPPGTLVKTVEKNGDVYEIWRGTLDMPDVHQLMKRVQVMVLFYIEGGSYIIDPEQIIPDKSLARWSVYFVYKKELNSEAANKTEYTFQGFATTYKFWMFQPRATSVSSGNEMTSDAWEIPKGDPNEDMIHRLRISQFLILPPFQGKGIGALLYNTIYEAAINSPTTTELTVEDPNEDFDLLRDLCDLKYLRKNVPEFAELKTNNSIHVYPKRGALRYDMHLSFRGGPPTKDGILDREMLEKMRVQTKIETRQFWRLVEMHLMSKLPDSVRPRAEVDAKKPMATQEDKHAYLLWRLILKARLYRRNVAVLGEYALPERIVKLNQTVSNVEWEYALTLDRLESKSSIPSDPVLDNSKRRLTSGTDVDAPASKKARVEDAQDVAK
ncbi:putative histone acetyltransferase type b catalytic subunit [Hypoxylon sp. FL1857]|nr:putative histone acetyltransferase type b catalytic subunit [Hypoxylon sp. FL1857]